MSSFHRAAIAATIVILGGASGFLAARLISRHAGTTLTPASATAVRPPPVTATAAVDRRIPEVVPDFTLADTAGVKHSISQWRGRPLVINFWATWCAPCRREIPLLKSLRTERARDGLEVVGIAVDFRDAVQQYAREMRMDYPVLVGEQDGLEAIAAFGMQTVFPFTVFADSKGRIVSIKVGELHEDEARLVLDQLESVDQGRTELPVARKAIADGQAALAAARARQESARLSAVAGNSEQKVP